MSVKLNTVSIPRNTLSRFPYLAGFGITRRSAASPCRMEAHPFLEFLFMFDGELRIVIENKLIKLRRNQFLLLKPGLKHAGEYMHYQRGAVCHIHFRPTLTGSGKIISLSPWLNFGKIEAKYILNNLNLAPRIWVRTLPEIGPMVIKLARELEKKEPGHQNRVHAITAEILVHFTRHLQTSPSHVLSTNAIYKLLSTLDSDIGRDWSLEKMADLTGLQKTAFIHRFKSETGQTPFQYILSEKIKKAKDLLSIQKKSITETAHHLGFHSSQHFSTTFKKITGIPPSQFLQNNSHTSS